jgi:predicted XRE-type DNA-binding protein
LKTAKRTLQVERSVGNVFDDLCLCNPQDRLAKAKIADRICQIITQLGLTQAKAAELLHLDQPKISALMRGKLKGFSVERLFRCLNDLGLDVEITIRPARRTSPRLTVAHGL